MFVKRQNRDHHTFVNFIQITYFFSKTVKYNLKIITPLFQLEKYNFKSIIMGE